MIGLPRSLLLAALALLAAAPVRAQEGPPDFPRTYTYDTPLAGWAEVTLWNTGVVDSSQPDTEFGRTTSRQGRVAHSIEGEYGVTDRLTMGGYLDFDDARDRSFRFTEGKLEARYRFSNRQDLFVNPGLYVEYYLPRKGFGDQELETRLILDKDLNDFRIAANPRLSFTTTGPEAGATPSVGLDLGLYYRRHVGLQPGLEYHGDFGRAGDWTGQHHYLEPTMDIALGKQLIWHVGAGAGLGGKADGFIAQSVLTVEFNVLRPSRLFGHVR